MLVMQYMTYIYCNCWLKNFKVIFMWSCTCKCLTDKLIGNHGCYFISPNRFGLPDESIKRNIEILLLVTIYN